ncbi:hypothetical protein Q8A73_015249 [Channa argus]|nr:hypothetical protein Q8A73_015249 [Channa argus]
MYFLPQAPDGVSLVNVSFILSNVTMDLNICSATKADTGSYQCKTQPPHAISQPVLIQITDVSITPGTVYADKNRKREEDEEDAVEEEAGSNMAASYRSIY